MQKPPASNGGRAQPAKQLPAPLPTKPPPPPPPEAKHEPTEPDALVYQRAMARQQLVEIELMDGVRLLARIIRFGRFSIHVDVLPCAGAADFAGPQVILKHGIRRLRVAPGIQPGNGKNGAEK
jgi:hypothetical protein